MPPAKRKPARRATVSKARRTSARKHPTRRVKIPKGGPIHARIGAKMVLLAVSHLDTHTDVLQSRKDAAILRATHEGCPKCKGNGQIFTKGKDGSFTGSKPCPAKPTTQKVSKWAVYKASRFGPDKNTGLVGWICPCGKKEKPRYRDAKEATKALRTHERQKHGGKSVGGAWYAQASEAETESAPTASTRKKTKTATLPRPRPTPAKDDRVPEPDYSNQDAPLAASQYAYSATLMRGPAKSGRNPSHDTTGTYTPPPGATVATLHAGLKNWYARKCEIPVADVILVRCELREK